MTTPILELRQVTKRFGSRVAVDRVDLTVHSGQSICLVGESGSGKTTTGRLLTNLVRPSSGTVLWNGHEVDHLERSERRRHRLDIQMIHQDPYASLNPARRVGATLTAPLLKHHLVATKGAAQQRCYELLDQVGLPPGPDLLRKYPHELSGGQRQRISIARALTVNPSVIVADEAVSMIDVSLRISILDTLSVLTRDRGMAVVLITHDLALARYFSADDDVAVMHQGRIVEQAPAAQLVAAAQHPYTQALLRAVPGRKSAMTTSPDDNKNRAAATRMPPSPAADPPPVTAQATTHRSPE